MEANLELMTAAVTRNPNDETARLALADAVNEAAGDIAARLLAAGWPADMVFTRDNTAAQPKGYWAKNAAGILARKPEVAVVVVGDLAVTKTGLTRSASGPVLYYRKSSGGRWGRSAETYRVTV